LLSFGNFEQDGKKTTSFYASFKDAQSAENAIKELDMKELQPGTTIRLNTQVKKVSSEDSYN